MPKYLSNFVSPVVIVLFFTSNLMLYAIGHKSNNKGDYKNYKTLERYLKRLPKSDNVSGHIDQISVWYEAKFKNHSPLSKGDRAFKEYLERFLDLRKVEKGCTDENIDTIRELSRSARVDYLKVTRDEKVKWNIVTYAIFLDIHCERDLSEIFEKKLNQMQENDLKLIQNFGTELASLRPNYGYVLSRVDVESKQTRKFLDKLFSLDSKDAELLEKVMIKKIEDDSNSFDILKRDIDRKTVEQLINKYIVYPCQNYLRIVGEQVFLMFLKYIEAIGGIRRSGEKWSELTKGWIDYKVCESLIGNSAEKLIDILHSQFRGDVIEGKAKLAWLKRLIGF